MTAFSARHPGLRIYCGALAAFAQNQRGQFDWIETLGGDGLDAPANAEQLPHLAALVAGRGYLLARRSLHSNRSTAWVYFLSSLARAGLTVVYQRPIDAESVLVVSRPS